MYKVLKAFDRYLPGQEMSNEDVQVQTERGNLPDLLKNKFITQLQGSIKSDNFAPVYAQMPIDELKAEAKNRGIRGYARMKKSTLIKRLEQDDNQ